MSWPQWRTQAVFHSQGIHALVSCAQAGGEDVKLTSVRGIELLTRVPDPDMISIREGALITLMVTLVFRSDNIRTKYSCCMALLNIASNESCR